jgi:thiamine kinase-like enzyme
MDQNEKDLLQAIAQIDDWKGKDIHYEAVTGGITNPNWKVIVDGKPYFVKVPGRGTEAFIDRKNAHLANLIAAREDIGPKVYYFLEDSGVEVFEFLEGYRTLNYGDVFHRDIFYKIVATIRRFHQHHETTLPLTQTPFEQTRTFMQLAKQLNCYLPPEMGRMEWLADQIEEAITTAGIQFVPCHNDFWTANYLYHEASGDLRLTDFEYAAMSDACWDFADISTANYFTEAMDVEWIRAYYGTFDELQFARLKLYKILKDIAWAMWSVVQAKQSSVRDFDYFNWLGTKMARLRCYWNDPRLDYWLNLMKGRSPFG